MRLRVVVRGPLEAMVDIVYPTRGASDEFLDLDRADFALRELTGLWIADNLEVREGDRVLAYPQIVEVRASLPYDASFSSYEQAFGHVTGPRLTNSVDFVWNQGLLDALLEYTIESDQARFSLPSKLSTLALKTTTTLSFLPPDGSTHAFEFTGNPGLIHLDPTWIQAVARFSRTGFFETLGGADYWLFLFVLAIPLSAFSALVPIAASFIAAATRSSSISLSSPIKLASMLTRRTSCLHVITTFTKPAPDWPSTSIVASSSCARLRLSCIAWACFISPAS